MSHRVEKFVSTLKHSLGEIFLKESDNPDFKFVIISPIEISSDLKNAKVFIKTIVSDVENVVEELNSSLGFIKLKLSQLMYFKYMPNIKFYKDKGIETEKLIEELERQKDEKRS